MPPKKKQRTSTASQNTKGGVTAGMVPESMADVPKARLLLRDWVVDAHKGRRGFLQKLKFPLEQGGSFLDFVQRAWSDETNLLQDSLALLKKLGMMDSESTVEDFMDKYLTLKDC